MSRPSTLSDELKYRLLLELSQKISRTLDLKGVLNDLLLALRSAIDYDAAGIYVLNRSVPLAPSVNSNLIAGMAQVGFGGHQDDDPMLRSGRGVIGHVIRSGAVVLAGDVRREPHYVEGRPSTLSELAVPIVSDSGVIGALNLESDQVDAFSEADAELLQFFASAAALSIGKALLHRQVLEKERIEGQLKVAREVQAGLLPRAAPDVAGYDIAAVNLPTWAIGGDYYDYIPLTEGRLGLVVADVSGKGIPAALIMATFRAALRTEMQRRTDVSRVVSTINKILLESPDASRFVTAVYGVLDLQRGSLPYVNCGHNPPMLLRAGGGCEMLQAGGPALGLFPDAKFEPGIVHLTPEDALVLYTDGVVEPSDREGTEFGTARLETVLREALERPAGEMLDSVVDATRAFSGQDGFDDDFTLVVVKRKAEASTGPLGP